MQSEKPDRDLRRLQEDELFLDSLYHVFKPTILQHQEQEDNESNWFILSRIASNINGNIGMVKIS